MPHCRRLVFLGNVKGQGGLLFEGQPLPPNQALRLQRKRSPWNPAREVERVIVGSHGARADILLEGEGIYPEHVRLYIPKESGVPADLLVINPASTRVNGRLVEPREWTSLSGGEELELGPWRFRYEEVLE